jgi:hypothetical protein
VKTPGFFAGNRDVVNNVNVSGNPGPENLVGLCGNL